MRLIFGLGKHMWLLENSSKLQHVQLEDGSSEDEDAVEHVSVDPHSSVIASTEVSPAAVDLSGWRFGFSAPIVGSDGSEG